MAADARISEEAAHPVPPVLLIGFNRPQHMRRQIDQLRDVKPDQIFVSIDGPRRNRPDDVRERLAVIDVLREIDWPCVVERRFVETNQGLNEGVVGAITWFFERVDRGVILEDDCLARPEFFAFAAELLDRFADDDRIMHISGNSLISDERSPTSYVFTSVGHIWGWATWRRAWNTIDPSMSGWTSVRREVRRSGPLGRALARKFDSASNGRKVRWARWWYLANVVNHGMAVVPTVNLVSNIGIGPEATNTVSGRHPLVLPTDVPMSFPLRHPDRVLIDPVYEKLSARYHSRSFKDRTGDRVASLVRRLRRLLRRNSSRI